MLNVLDPSMTMVTTSGSLAPRPKDLNGKVLWFVEGGASGMNRFFLAWKEQLEKEYRFAAIHYIGSDNVGTPFRQGKEKFEEIARSADVIINGVAL